MTASLQRATSSRISQICGNRFLGRFDQAKRADRRTITRSLRRSLVMEILPQISSLNSRFQQGMDGYTGGVANGISGASALSGSNGQMGSLLGDMSASDEAQKSMNNKITQLKTILTSTWHSTSSSARRATTLSSSLASNGLDMRRACRGPVHVSPRMSSARFETIVRQMCESLDLPDVESVLSRRVLWVEGFEVYLHLPTPQPGDDAQQEALYLRIAYGLPPAGRTLTVLGFCSKPIFQCMRRTRHSLD